MKKSLLYSDASARNNDCSLATAGAGLFTGEVWQQIALTLKLSPREVQIAQGIFNDQKEFTLASDLHISSHTVHSETERLRRKLKVHGRVGLVLCIVREYIRLCSNQLLQPLSVCVTHPAGPPARPLVRGLPAPAGFIVVPPQPLVADPLPLAGALSFRKNQTGSDHENRPLPA